MSKIVIFGFAKMPLSGQIDSLFLNCETEKLQFLFNDPKIKHGP